MKLGSRLLLAWIIVLLVAILPGASARSLANYAFQDDVARQKARTMLSKMSPEERVGQLFLITMNGTTIDEKSQVYDLIANHHVGGVMLLRSNDNFASENTLTQAYQLTRLIQETEWIASRVNATNPVSGVQFSPNYIPMLVGISQEGDSAPNDQMLNGVTPLPDLMSIGATWNLSMAKQVGKVMGQELSALGFNLYLGPSLDVLDTIPQKTSGEDLGVRSFGGDPYWVGKMGQAYVSGLHEGSAQRLLIVSKHFPGSGGSDRSPEDEIATVRKSFEELKQFELAPFFAVTGNAPSPDLAVDGLLVSHIRYQGFQGNIRATTRPVSSDAAALEKILNINELANWRNNAGVLISDNLGSQAIRKFYDPTGRSFDARTAAREAFLAGNDLLYLDRFQSTNDPDVYTTIVRTLESFAQKYREDDTFAQRVDDSVERVLTLKYRLYPEFDFAKVSPDQFSLNGIGTSQSVTMDVARRAVTLISPTAAELTSLLPRAPETRERIVFLTDVQTSRQCSGCAEQVTLPVDALQSAVLRLYGPRAGGLVQQQMLTSYPFSDLLKILNGYPSNDPAPPLETDLRVADWVVVSMLKPDVNAPETLALSRLLSERPDLLRNKKVIVFAFNAPYYLDATDISKLTAYYGIYGKTQPFIDIAAKVLFQEQLTAPGLLPVTVPGVGYDLIKMTSPDPSQVIPLEIDTPQVPTPQAGTLAAATPAPIFKVNDIIPLRTGVIYDRNHNPVPDGTPVHFVFSTIFTSSGESGSTQSQVDTETIDGVARFTYRIERNGILDIHVATDQGARSSLIRLDTLSGGVTVVPPTPQPSITPAPTLTTTPTPTVTPTVVLTPVTPATVHVSDWFFALLMVLVTGVGVAYIGIRQAITRWGLRWALCGVIGGMATYTYIALSLPGSQKLIKESSTTGVLSVTLIGVLVGWGIGLIWKRLEQPESRGPAERVTGERDRITGERPATGPKSQSN